MSNRGRHRIDSSAARCPLFIIIFALWVMGAPALAAERVGFLDDRGTFVEKAEVSTKGSTIVVRKIKPKDTFASLNLKFIFPGARKPRAMKGLFIQWEKEPGHLGRRWPLDRHRRFDARSATMKTSWNESMAFALLDQSGRRLFAGKPWDRILEIRLEGRLLRKRPSVPPVESRISAQADVVPPQKHGPVAPAPPAIPAPPPQVPAARPEAAPAPPPVTSESAGSLQDNAINELLQRQDDLKKELDKLTRRVSDVEHAVMLAQRWFYWGPLLALTLSILFSSVALFLTFIRLSRTRTRHTTPPSRYGKVHLSSQDRSRRMG